MRGDLQIEESQAWNNKYIHSSICSCDSNLCSSVIICQEQKKCSNIVGGVFVGFFQNLTPTPFRAEANKHNNTYKLCNFGLYFKGAA